MLGKQNPVGIWGVIQSNVFQDSTNVVAVGTLAMMAMLLVPLPVIMLDFFQLFNVVLSVMIMITVLGTRNVLDFASLPSVLLFSTLFRLSINVSSTRLILQQGANFQGKVVRTFADFMVGGDYLVGFIVFIVITAVMFLVITKGSTRVSEVGARFQLDAMPQKQLAIDTELSQGLINENQAIERRELIQKEAAFYGNMDGASKFVSGDVTVGILITIINIVGGLITGIVLRQESLGFALKNYVMLSIGDGLVAQIPTLLVSTATGVIVTKSISKESLGDDVKNELFSDPKSFYISGGSMLFLSFIPGFPRILLWGMTGSLFFLGYVLFQSQRLFEEKETSKQKDKEKAEIEDTFSPEKISEVLFVDPIEIELGYALVPLVDEQNGGDLLDRIKKIRKQVAMDLGLVIPQVRVVDNIQLDPEEYILKIEGIRVSSGKIRVGKLMALGEENVPDLTVEKTLDPVFGLNAYWINSSDKQLWEKSGYTVFDGPTIISTHLTEIVKRDAARILTRKDVQMILDGVNKRNSVIIGELNKLSIKTGDIQKVLQKLLNESISIRNIDTILESICDGFPSSAGTGELVDYVRQSLSRQISSKYCNKDQEIWVARLSEAVELQLLDSIGAGILEAEPELINLLLQEVGEKMKSLRSKGNEEILLVDSSIRSHCKDLLNRIYGSKISVISYGEIAEGYKPMFVEVEKSVAV